jgi:hypothetical protein
MEIETAILILIYFSYANREKKYHGSAYYDCLIDRIPDLQLCPAHWDEKPFENQCDWRRVRSTSGSAC